LHDLDSQSRDLDPDFPRMRCYPFVTLDVFTNRRFGGNPLAVFTAAGGLSDNDMQSLAQELNLSETTFVLPPDDPAHSARVRIFNRTAEMPFAGHPTVGTGFVLAEQGHARDGTVLLEVIAGIVAVTVRRDQAGIASGATIVAPQPLSLGHCVDAEIVAACAKIDAADIIRDTHPPMIASTGHPFVIAEVSPSALSRAEPVVDAFRRAVAEHSFLAGNLRLHLYSRDGNRIRARMFAPLAGTLEDPATGSANAPLAALLLSRTTDEERTYEITQGVEMGRPSFLDVRAWRKDGEFRASVGGDCVRVFSGEFRI
jgi:trans-2,3-dihydro-3-hydroxyanthranilate isomerase